MIKCLVKETIIYLFVLSTAIFWVQDGKADELRQGAPSHWQVQKISGEAYLISMKARPVSLSRKSLLQAGDKIRTGLTGRVLLMRGKETVMIAPNTVISLPKEKTEAGKTTLIQQMGTILLEVEKKNVKHFEVRTPYLAAVVKGTQFEVTVTAKGAFVKVNRGRVEVRDYQSGQYIDIVPGQSARVRAGQKTGFDLSGKGPFQPILKGSPLTSPVQPVPQAKFRTKTHPAAPILKVKERKLKSARVQIKRRPIKSLRRVVRLRRPIGAVRMNFQKASKGLATDKAGRAARSQFAARFNKSRRKGTIWNGGYMAERANRPSPDAYNNSVQDFFTIGAAMAAVNAYHNGNNGQGWGVGGTPPGGNGNNGQGWGVGGTPPGGNGNNGQGWGVGGTPPGGNGNNGQGWGVGGTPPGGENGNGGNSSNASSGNGNSGGWGGWSGWSGGWGSWGGWAGWGHGHPGHGHGQGGDDDDDDD